MKLMIVSFKLTDSSRYPKMGNSRTDSVANILQLLLKKGFDLTKHEINATQLSEFCYLFFPLISSSAFTRQN